MAPYTCDLCDTRVKTRQGLAGHIRFRHAGMGPPTNYRPSEAGHRETTAAVLRRVEILEERVRDTQRWVWAIGFKLGLDPDIMLRANLQMDALERAFQDLPRRR